MKISVSIRSLNVIFDKTDDLRCVALRIQKYLWRLHTPSQRKEGGQYEHTYPSEIYEDWKGLPQGPLHRLRSNHSHCYAKLEHRLSVWLKT